MASPVVYSINELVAYKEKLCLIQGITKTIHGFNTYHLEDIESDKVYVAHKHELTKATEVITLDQDFGEEFELQIPVPPILVAPKTEAPAAPKSNRFLDLREEQVDAIADSRTAKNTNIQTKWGLNVFKGECKMMV